MIKVLKRIVALCTASMICAAAFFGCSTVQNDEQILTVVATVYPSYDFALQLTEDFNMQCDIKLLLTPGGESHSYEPSPSDVAAIQSCDLFVYIGGTSEIWVEDLLKARKDKANLRMMDYVTPIAAAHNHEEHDHAATSDAEYDEHIWTAPLNAVAMTETIADEIAALSPENAAVCAQNAKNLCAELQQLDTAYRTLAASTANKPLVFGDRFPFLYLADAYGFAYEAAFTGCTGDTDASAATLSALITTVKEQQISTVFYLENSSRKIADAICEATGAKSAILHSCNNVTREDFESGKHFQAFVQENLAAIKEALQ